MQSVDGPYRAERDPDSRPPTNALQRVANGVHTFYKWTKTPEALVCGLMCELVRRLNRFLCSSFSDMFL